MNWIFETVEGCIYAVGVAFIGCPWVLNLPNKKCVEFTLLGIAMICFMFIVSVIVKIKQQNK